MEEREVKEVKLRLKKLREDYRYALKVVCKFLGKRVRDFIYECIEYTLENRYGPWLKAVRENLVKKRKKDIEKVIVERIVKEIKSYEELGEKTS